MFNFLTGLNRKFVVPSEKRLRTSMIPKLYKEVQFTLLEILREILGDSYFAVTCDIWSSLALDSYLGVTVHFITTEFDRKHLVIRCLHYNESHTGQKLPDFNYVIGNRY